MKKKTILSVLLVLAVLFLAALLFLPRSAARAPDGLALAPAALIEAIELSARLEKGPPPFLLDVRTPQEYAESHIDGAIHIPLPELAFRLHEVPRDRTIVVYCRTGSRSARAAAVLRSQGYEKVENLAGGLLAFRAQSACQAKGSC